jgi:hypothetical protein
LYCSPYDSRGITSSGTKLAEHRNAFKVYEWRFERDLPLERPGLRRKDEIEVGIREI